MRTVQLKPWAAQHGAAEQLCGRADVLTLVACVCCVLCPAGMPPGMMMGMMGPRPGMVPGAPGMPPGMMGINPALAQHPAFAAAYQQQLLQQQLMQQQQMAMQVSGNTNSADS